MLALRSTERGLGGTDSAWAAEAEAEPHSHASDWLPLQQAACELGISPGTARRMIRRGELRNRVVPRPGGFAYLVYLPNSWHARLASADRRGAVAPSAEPTVPPSWRERAETAWSALGLSMRRALRPPAPARPLRLAEAEGPFARYRWLARRRRWWHF